MQVLGKLPMTAQMLKGSGLLAMLQQAVKELGEGSPARDPATKTLQRWRTLMRPTPVLAHASNGVRQCALVHLPAYVSAICACASALACICCTPGLSADLPVKLLQEFCKTRQTHAV